MFRKDDSPQQLVSNFYYVYYKAAQMVSVYFSEEWFAKHGSLLPTDNGHNGRLSEEEIDVMNHFVRHCIAQPIEEEKII